MPSFRRVALLFAASVAVVACNNNKGAVEVKAQPELFADMCAQLFSCGCQEYPYADEEQCRHVNAVDYAGVEASAKAAGLTVDFNCLLSRMPVSQFECKTLSELIEEEEAAEGPTCNYCSLAYGTSELGQPCVEYGLFDDCAAGLACRDGVCVDPCAPLGEGDDCFFSDLDCGPGLYCNFDTGVCERLAGEGEPCASEFDCAEGLYCDFGAEVCVDLPELGEPCPNFVCAPGLECASSDMGGLVCGPLPGLGEPCDLDCQEPYVCAYDFDTDMAVCSELGKAGDSCLFVPCGPALGCDPNTDTCQPYPGPGQPCFDYECADGAYCDWLLDVCRALPGEGEPCADGYLCADGLECDSDDVCQPERPLICEVW